MSTRTKHKGGKGTLFFELCNDASRKRGVKIQGAGVRAIKKAMKRVIPHLELMTATGIIPFSALRDVLEEFFTLVPDGLFTNSTLNDEPVLRDWLTAEAQALDALDGQYDDQAAQEASSLSATRQPSPPATPDPHNTLSPTQPLSSLLPPLPPLPPLAPSTTPRSPVLQRTMSTDPTSPPPTPPWTNQNRLLFPPVAPHIFLVGVNVARGSKFAVSDLGSLYHIGNVWHVEVIWEPSLENIGSVPLHALQGVTIRTVIETGEPVIEEGNTMYECIGVSEIVEATTGLYARVHWRNTVEILDSVIDEDIEAFLQRRADVLGNPNI